MAQIQKTSNTGASGSVTLTFAALTANTHVVVNIMMTVGSGGTGASITAPDANWTRTHFNGSANFTGATFIADSDNLTGTTFTFSNSNGATSSPYGTGWERDDLTGAADVVGDNAASTVTSAALDDIGVTTTQGTWVCGGMICNANVVYANTWTNTYVQQSVFDKTTTAAILLAAGQATNSTESWDVAANARTVLVAYATGAAPATEVQRMAPDAILASTGLTGTVTDIQDDPDTPDANWLVAP